MAKKKNIKPDDYGYLRTGIYTEYAGPGVPLCKETQARFEQIGGDYSKDLNLSAQDRIDSIRKDFLVCLGPYLSGPISSEEARTLPDDPRLLNVNGTIEIFTLQSGVTAKENPSPEAKQVQDALKALHELDTIAHNLETGNTDLQMRSAIRLGRLIERVKVRPFEHRAHVGAGKIAGTHDMRNNKKSREKLKCEAIEALEKAKREYPDLGKTAQKERAAELLGIRLRAFQNRLKF